MLQNLPVLDDVDVLVLGGTTAAVTCALRARRAGRTVMLIAPRAYLGEDIAARFAYWDQPRHDTDARKGTGTHTREGTAAGPDAPVAPDTLALDLCHALFGAGTQPPTPMHVKLTLEKMLVDADIPFVLTTCPAGALVDEAGRIRGSVIANRAGRQAIVARHVIDASIEATFSQLAGHPGPKLRGRQRITHVTLCYDAGRDAQGIEVEHLPGYQGIIRDQPYDLSARRYTLEVDLGDGSPDALNRAQAEVFERCWVPEQYVCQEQLVVAEPSATTQQAHRPALDACTPMPGLTVLSPGGPGEDVARQAFARPCNAIPSADALATALVDQVDDEPAPALDTLRVACHQAQLIDRGQIRTLTDALRPGQTTDRTIACNSNHLPILGSYDVLVVGGGTGGAPAAISAAMAGARTAVIEATPALGGVGTLGQIACYWFGNRVGFTHTIDHGVAQLEFREPFKQAKGKWSVAAKAAYLHRQCHQHGVSMWFRSFCVGVWVEGPAVKGIVVAGPHGYGLIEAKVIIDSTGCADIPAAAGAPTIAIDHEHVAVQGVGLAGLQPGRDYHNSDHNFSDDTDLVDTTAFFVSSRRKFADHFDVGQLVDSRERRQIVGELTLDPVDFLYQRRFPDTICISSSNFDSHGYTIHPVFMIKPPDKQRLWVDVPYRCLLPRGVKGVLVTGLGVSAHRDALPVIRMQADVQNQGYAAGQAAAMAVAQGIDVRDIDIRALQQRLVEAGCLPDRVLTDTDSFPIPDDQLDDAIAHGWDDYTGLALIFSDPARSLPRLRAALDTAPPEPKQRYALILALMNDPAGCDILRQAVAQTTWDQGWNYQGMGQFGMTMSALDALIVGLGRVGDPDTWDVLVQQARALIDRARTASELPEFSHVRALTLAFESLHTRHPNPDACQPLTQFLDLPSLAGHAQTTMRHVIDALTDDTNENNVRNNALRELHLARALVRLGDTQQRGHRILQQYAHDLRGHFARHARAILHHNTHQPAPEPLITT